MKTHTFFNKIILRTPLKKTATNITWEKIQTIFQQTLYREALFVASPALYQLLQDYETQPTKLKAAELASLKMALYKYYSRFSNRCTPFGLFALVSTLGLGKKTAIDITTSSIRKATKFDTFFLASLLQVIDKERAIRQQLNYYVNSSMYAIGDKYRYVEYYHKKEVRFHKIAGVDRNDYLDKIVILAKKGATLENMAISLANEQVDQSQLLDFLHTLIDNQFLVSELAITVSGSDYLEQLITTLSEERFNSYEAKTVITLLNNIQAKLKAIEADNTGTIQPYLDLFQQINQQFDSVSQNKLFQVDTYRELEAATLSYATLKQLRIATEVINKLSPEPITSNLDNFKQKFLDRYEAYEMPLVQVLDPDIGIGYARELGAKTPLVEGLAITGKQAKTAKVDWDKKQSLLIRKLLNCYQNGSKEVVLTEADLKPFEEKESAYFDTFSIFFNVFREGTKNKIHVKGLWGPSATNLIGRFTHLDQSIHELSQDIGKTEEAIYTDKIIAEIIHLPQARVGNVLHRTNTRNYEIPYLAKSSLPQEQQININDLMISVKYGKIILRSKSLNKEVIPRLSNAHNYSANALPIYHFLCDLQMQGSQTLGFSFGALQYEFPFIPRVSFRDIVLSRATWHLDKKEITDLYQHKNNAAFLKAFIHKRKLPTVVMLTQGDNEVLINFDNELSCQVFFSMIKNKGIISLKEFLFQEDSITGEYANEFVASVHKNIPKETVKEMNTNTYKDTQTTTTYSIGDEWLYYKFYCGDKIAEKVLQEAVLPIIKDLQAKQLIQKWFFIRYLDKDGFHIRLRLQLSDTNHFTACINSIKYHIAPLETAGLIWKTQVDKYLRETERYGYYSMEDTERFFHADSECTLQFVNIIEGEQGEQVRWLFALLSMERLLVDFGYNLKQKIAIMHLLKTSFGKEFNRNGVLNKQINDLYRTHEKTIEQFLDKDQKTFIYQPLWDILATRSTQFQGLPERLQALNEAKKLPSSLALGIIPSYIHMVCNRIFLNKQRIHEMVVYDFLHKYYNKQLHMQKKKGRTRLTSNRRNKQTDRSL